MKNSRLWVLLLMCVMIVIGGMVNYWAMKAVHQGEWWAAGIVLFVIIVVGTAGFYYGKWKPSKTTHIK